MNELSLSRDSILIYLNNLRITETIIHQSKKAREKLSTDLYQKGNEVNNAQANLQSLENKTPTASKSDYNAIVTIISACFLFAIIGLVIGLISGFNHDFEFIKRGGRGLKNGAILGLIGSVIFSIYVKSSDEKTYQETLRKAQDELIHNTNEARNKYTTLNEEFKKKKPIIEREIAKLDSIISHMDKIRSDMYQLNIIPYTPGSSANLRSLEGVQYLYEFMSNSRESFLTAVYNYKLDSIISRLDTLIANTEHIISNQQRLMSQQDQILQRIKNQERTMERTRESLENIEDYSKMIAQNSELQTSMEKEALYYQRVRYYRDL